MKTFKIVEKNGRDELLNSDLIIEADSREEAFEVMKSIVKAEYEELFNIRNLKQFDIDFEDLVDYSQYCMKIHDIHIAWATEDKMTTYLADDPLEFTVEEIEPKLLTEV